jgi:hypothetical protein
MFESLESLGALALVIAATVYLAALAICIVRWPGRSPPRDAADTTTRNLYGVGKLHRDVRYPHAR